eukprot:TRINITY_DN2010_c0_g1_i1.p1 TRINITY_DN2010_c0_g1~~TRINITY_DN2010_c0_g1_i1.p1  ORF type:complete len:499 (-),score=96.68 TRINITY_DN2010_c0_g1_i1:108-1604(-)
MSDCSYSFRFPASQGEISAQVEISGHTSVRMPHVGGEYRADVQFPSPGVYYCRFLVDNKTSLLPTLPIVLHNGSRWNKVQVASSATTTPVSETNDDLKRRHGQLNSQVAALRRRGDSSPFVHDLTARVDEVDSAVHDDPPRYGDIVRVSYRFVSDAQHKFELRLSAALGAELESQRRLRNKIEHKSPRHASVNDASAALRLMMDTVQAYAQAPSRAACVPDEHHSTATAPPVNRRVFASDAPTRAPAVPSVGAVPSAAFFLSAMRSRSVAHAVPRSVLQPQPQPTADMPQPSAPVAAVPSFSKTTQYRAVVTKIVKQSVYLQVTGLSNAMAVAFVKVLPRPVFKVGSLYSVCVHVNDRYNDWCPFRVISATPLPDDSLHVAIQQDDDGAVRSFVSDGGDVNAVCPWWPVGTLALFAAKCGALKSLQCLVEHGADVNAQTTGDKRTPLMLAVLRGDEVMIVYLVRSVGARTAIRDVDGKSAFSHAVARGMVSSISHMLL